MKTISEIMQPQSIVIRRDETLRRSLELLIENSISGSPVIDDEGNSSACWSEKDLLKILSEPDARSIVSIMTRDRFRFRSMHR